MKFALVLAFTGAAILVRPAAASIDQGLLALVPESTVVLTSVDADATRSSGFGQYLLQRLDAEDQHLQKFTADTGFDPRRDLQDVLFASFNESRAQTRSKFAILARGLFDPGKIASAAEFKGSFSRRPYSGTSLFVSREQSSDTAFAFPETGVIAIGDTASVKQILDRRASPSTLDPGLLERVNRVGRGNDMWFASLLSGSALGRNLDFPGPTSQLKNSSALQSILQSTGGLRFGNQVSLSFDATTRSPQDATSLTDVVRFLSSMIQTQRRNDANAAIISSALDTMQLKANGPEFHLGLSISEKNLEFLAQSDAKHGQ